MFSYIHPAVLYLSIQFFEFAGRYDNCPSLAEICHAHLKVQDLLCPSKEKLSHCLKTWGHNFTVRPSGVGLLLTTLSFSSCDFNHISQLVLNESFTCQERTLFAGFDYLCTLVKVIMGYFRISGDFSFFFKRKTSFIYYRTGAEFVENQYAATVFIHIN